METQTRIIEIIRQVSKQQISPAPDESLFDSGLLDSFALPDMVSALEKEFKISVPDADLTPRKFDTLERIESYIKSRS